LLEDIGGALFRIGAYNAALTALRLGLIVNPKSAVMHHDLASCYMRLHEIDVAISEYRQSIRYDPTLPEPHYDLGLALFEFHHDKAAALEQCDILRRLDAKSADRLYKEINK
jgi:tetratricopeptide (TPR) repeat protein